MKRNSKGFTLIEYAICSLATMIMLAATFTLLNSVFMANAGMGELMQTQQNVRVAMNTITRDATMAGTGLPSGGITVPNGADSAALARPGVGGDLTTPNNTIAILSPGNGVGPSVNGVATDALTITTINQESPTWNILDINDDGTEIEFVQEVRNGTMQLFDSDLLVLTNVNGSVFGCVTSVSMTSSVAFFADADPLNINQPDAEFGNIRSILNEDGTFPPTTATRINLVTYYINNAAPAHPRLMRAVNAQAAQVIVEDIENLQFAYDLFDFETNSSTANQATTATPNQIRSVHVSISGRSPQVLERTGRYYRFSLVSKVNVRNTTFRNRYTGS
jgi:hypothetical protein